LKLGKEVVRALGQPDLKEVAGGIIARSFSQCDTAKLCA